MLLRFAIVLGVILGTTVLIGESVLAQECVLEPNVTSTKAPQIENCIRSILDDEWPDPDTDMVPLVRRDAACVEVHAALFNYAAPENLTRQREVEGFCKEVVAAQKAVYGTEPFWTSCDGENRVSPKDIRRCILGTMRLTAAYRLPSQVRYCPQALELYTTGTTFAALSNRPEGLDEKYCDIVMNVIAELQEQEKGPCFMRGRLDIESVFARCMAGNIEPNKSCLSLQREFNTRYHDANGGYPAEYNPDRNPPSCEFIDSLRTEPFVAAENQVDDNVQNGDTANIDASETRLVKERKAIFNGKFLIFLLAIMALAFFPHILHILFATNPELATRRIGVFLLRIAFQFHPASIVSALIGMFVPIIYLSIALGLSFSIPYLIARGMDLPNPLASGLFANFVVVATGVILNFALGIKREFKLKAMFDQVVGRLTRGEQLGKELFAEAVTRNFIILFVVAIATASAVSSSATYLGIAALFSEQSVQISFDQYKLFLAYFSNLIFQLLTFEIPKELGFSFGPSSLPGGDHLLIYYTIFVKVVTIGSILELLRSIWRDLGVIYREVDETVREHLKRDGKDYTSSEDRVRIPNFEMRFSRQSPTLLAMSFSSKSAPNA